MTSSSGRQDAGVHERHAIMDSLEW